MTKRSEIVLVVAGCVVVALVSLFVALRIYVHSREKVNLTNNKVRQMIDRELPRGTARSGVKKFLATQGWPHSDDESTTVAMIPDTEHSFLIRKDIRLNFFFDANDRLISYDLKALFTGP